MILRLKCQEKLFLSIETLLYGVTGIWFLSKVIWAYLYYFDIFLSIINMGTCTRYGILTLVEKEPMVPVHLGHWSRLLNRDQLLGTNAGPGSSTNRDR
jgi:hypothetical protein